MRIAELMKNLEMLVSHLDEKNVQGQFEKGFHWIVEYKNCGGSKQESYDTLLSLAKKYRDEYELMFDLIGDWLDCISGWVGNKDYQIWNE